MATRRDFLKKSILAASAVPLMHTGVTNVNSQRPASALSVNIFSKHLQFLNYHDMASAAREIGFDGVDLTVRPNGHVLPERVESDLPKAIEAIRQAGLSHTMMTTAVDDASDAVDKRVLETAATQGIKFYRMNWLTYPPGSSIPEAVKQFQQTIRGLSILNRKLGIVGAYQNHAGPRAGASIWELHDMVSTARKSHMGVQYDIRHAVVEGGLSWKTGLRLIHPEIKILAIKDFIWEKRDGRYYVQDVPLGTGMVDFKSYFTLLKEYGVNVPVSLHIEYPVGGAEHGLTKITVDENVVFDAMRRDLKWLRDTWNSI